VEAKLVSPSTYFLGYVKLFDCVEKEKGGGEGEGVACKKTG